MGVTGRVESLGTRVRLSGPAEAELELSDGVRAMWQVWSDRYREATGSGRPETLLALGRDLFDWLDMRRRWLYSASVKLG